MGISFSRPKDSSPSGPSELTQELVKLAESETDQKDGKKIAALIEKCDQTLWKPLEGTNLVEAAEKLKEKIAHPSSPLLTDLIDKVGALINREPVLSTSAGIVSVSHRGPLTPEVVQKLLKLNGENPIDELYIADPDFTLDDLKALQKQLPQLKGFGNRAAHWAGKEDLQPYLNHFKEGSLKLRVLHLPAELDLDTAKFEKIMKDHQSNLHEIFIDSHKIEELDANSCSSLKSLSAPEATKLYARGCSSLESLSAPKATYLTANSCSSLKSLSAPKATYLTANSCSSLKSLSAPEATKLYARGCSSLKSLSAPEATRLDARGCSSLKSLSAPEATYLTADGCSSLKSLSAPKATYLTADGCSSLKSLSAPKAKTLYADGCSSLKSLSAPQAKTLLATGCSSLKSLSAPEATRLDARGCSSLKSLSAPEATELDARGCSSLESLSAPKAKTLALSTLPAGLENLERLTRLTLYEPISGLSEAVFQLESGCTVDISNCRFSVELLERISQRVQEEGYQGPSISFSRIEGNQGQGERPIEQILKELYKLAGDDFKPLENIPGKEVTKEDFSAWLNRLSYMADYRAGEQRQKWVAKNVLRYVELADTDPDYRQIFSLNIQEAVATCGDRVSLYLLYLGVAKKVIHTDLSNTKELANLLLRGVWALDMLETCAREKIPTLKFFDEIEVYLGYPVMLKEKLGLPIDVEGMLYFSCSALTKEDLATAEGFVNESLNNQEACATFLVSQNKWIDALQAKYPNEMASAKETRDQYAEDTGDYVKAGADYDTCLKKLTMTALD